MAGRGSIEEREKGSYRLTVSMGFDQNEKRIKKQKTVKAKNKTEANKLLAAFITEIEAGEYIEPSKIKFSDFAEEWKDKYAVRHLSGKTLENYTFPLKNFIIPTFGPLRLEDIKPIHIVNYLDSLSKEGVRKDGKEGRLLSSTIQYHHRILRDSFGRATEWGLIKTNPLEKVKRPKVTQNKTDVYTKHEEIELFKLLQSEPIH